MLYSLLTFAKKVMSYPTLLRRWCLTRHSSVCSFFSNFT